MSDEDPAPREQAPGELDYRLPSMQVGFDYGQFYMFGDPAWRELDEATELKALDDADQRKVGAADGLVVVLSPAQFHFDASLEFEVWTGEPPLELDDYDQVVDIDLDVPHGVVYVQVPGMPELAQAMWLRTAGRYRARLEGRGYTAHQDTRLVEGGPDSYRAQLWPRTRDQPPALRREWPGWDSWINPAPTDA